MDDIESASALTAEVRPLAVSVDEAGRLLSVSRDLVYDMVARRELVAVRLGRRIVIPVRALEDVLAGRETAPG